MRTSGQRQGKPSGFGLCTRIVYIHQLICLAIFLVGLRSYPARGIYELVIPHWLGIVISTAVVVAMIGVASRKSIKALVWLRVILWIEVVKILIVQLLLLAQGRNELDSYIHTMLVNELFAIPLAVYWSRPVHNRYLKSLNQAGLIPTSV